MANVSHQPSPSPVRVEGNVQYEPLVGRGGGFGGVALHQRRLTRRAALLQFEWLGLSKTRGALAFGGCPRRPGRGDRATPPGCSREDHEEKSCGFVTAHKPRQVYKKKTIVAHVSKW
jgi:hypothetical protein